MKTGICLVCLRERQIVAHGLCNPCHVADYKKRTGYKGPVRACLSCGTVTFIHAHDICRSCFNKKYAIDHREAIQERHRKNRKAEPEKFSARFKKWAEKNKEKKAQYQQGYYKNNKSKLRDSRRKVALEKRITRTNNEKSARAGQLVVAKEASRKLSRLERNERTLAQLQTDLPPLKKSHVVEFINGPFRNHSLTSKLTFLKHLHRLIDHIKAEEGDASAPWNNVKNITIEQCQIQTGSLKDSLRVFFHWLYKRKRTSEDLSDAIPAQSNSRRLYPVNLKKIKDLERAWNSESCPLDDRLMGQFVMRYGMTVKELRELRVSDFEEGFVKLKGEKFKLAEALNSLVHQYFVWRDDFYFGHAQDYFFVTGESLTKKQSVSQRFINSTFSKYQITPSHLRGMMINYVRTKNEVFAVADFFRISPRAAAIYYDLEYGYEK